MNTFESLKHATRECKYPVVFIPKYREKVLYQQLRRGLGAVFRDLAQRQESEIIEGAPDGRSCAYADLDSTQALNIFADGVHEGQECDPRCAGVGWAAAQLCGAALLGPGGIGYRRWDRTRRPCFDTSKTRRRKTSD